MAKGTPAPVRSRIPVRKNGIWWALAVSALLALVLAAGPRIPVGNGITSPIYGINDIRFGIDIKGGYDIVFVPDLADGQTATADQLASARAIISLRLDSKNIADRELTVDNANGRILVRYPLKSGETVGSASGTDAVKELGATAKLTFVDPDGNVVIDGTDVKESHVEVQNGSPVVVLSLNPAGTTKFAEATAKWLYKTITIKMDDKTISSPTVNAVISDGNAIIEGMADTTEAKTLSDNINAGALPFSLKAVSVNIISPTLGQGALDVMVRAALVAFLLIILFMILYYRLPGFVAVIALFTQMVCTLLAVTIPQFTLTLPGIAGIILSIGMGVDANILIAERIREELRAGNSLRFAVAAGFQRAFSAVLDGNLTTMFPAALLWIMGSGAIKAFGFTLLFGVALNLLTGVVMSRVMTGSLSLYPAFQNPWLYGGRRNGK